MKKIHRIGNSKVPTINQLERMAENLHTVHPRSYVNLAVNVMTYFDGSQKTDYWLSIEGIGPTKYRDWPATIAEYRRLMKGAKND